MFWLLQAVQTQTDTEAQLLPLPGASECSAARGFNMPRSGFGRKINAMLLDLLTSIFASTSFTPEHN